MYSRSTDRGGRRIKLPPGYDGSAFRHDTGEVRRFGGDTEMKIHSPVWPEDRPEAVDRMEEDRGDGRFPVSPRPMEGEMWESGREEERHGTENRSSERAEREKTDPESVEQAHGQTACGGECTALAESGHGSFLEGLLSSLGSEDWLLLLVILLLLADGSDAWDLILLLGVLLAVK